MHLEKEFSKNSSLVTHNAVSHCSIEIYSANSPYTTRHPTHHQNHCILLRIWILHTHFTPHSLVTIKKVTSESALQLILYQNDMPYNGDEWVTSETKWITAATIWHIKLYNAMGDELQSYVKILMLILTWVRRIASACWALAKIFMDASPMLVLYRKLMRN